MATTVTYTGSLSTKLKTSGDKYYSSNAGQGYQKYAASNLVGIVAFPDMNLGGKLVQSVSLSVTANSSGTGAWYTKTVYLNRATVQGAIDTTTTGQNYVGNALGTFTGSFYNNTTSNAITGTLLTGVAAYIEAGNNTFVIYEESPTKSSYGDYSANFMVWTACSITVTYEEGASVPTTNVSSVNIGTGSVTISTNRTNTGKTHTITYSFGSATGTIGTAQAVGASVSWTPPYSLCNQIPSATSGLCTITCQTYYGGNLVGTKTCTLTLTVPESVKPTIAINSTSEANSTVAAKNIGAYVQGKSLLSAAVTATKAYGSAIARYSMTIEGFSYTLTSSAVTATLTSTRAFSGSGSVTVTVSVTDARGRTGTASTTVTVVAYSPPSITNFTAERCNSDGSAAQVDGTKIRVTASGSVSPLKVGTTNKNTIACRVWYRTAGASSWESGDALTPTNYALSVTNRLLSQTFSALNSYNLRLIITDIFESVEVTVDVSTKTVVMDFRANGNGVAFGKVAETDNVAEFAWPLKLSTPLSIANGGTGASNAVTALALLGGNNASNITDGTLNMERLPFKVAYGRVTVNSTSGMSISYSSAGFTSAPIIVCGYWATGSNTTLPDNAARVVNITATGATVCGKTNWTVAWIAIGT